MGFALLNQGGAPVRGGAVESLYALETRRCGLSKQTSVMLEILEPDLANDGALAAGSRGGMWMVVRVVRVRKAPEKACCG